VAGPTWPAPAIAQDQSRTDGPFSTRPPQPDGWHGAAGSRRASTLRRISRQPPTVLTLTPSVLNSARPAAFPNAATGSPDSPTHLPARPPSSRQTRSIVSSDTSM
jgi:hypothetical protein